MEIIQSSLFLDFKEIIFGLSTKSGVKTDSPFGFNLSFTVGDQEETVKKNRELFFNELGLSPSEIAVQMQIHSDIITIVDKGGMTGESDALITGQKGLGLAVSTADCVPVFIYDKAKKIIAAVHSGWRGTQKKIVLKTLIKLNQEFGSNASDLFVYMGPSISKKNYEVGMDVAEQFDKKYSSQIGGKIVLDVPAVNRDLILDFGVPENQLEISPLCSYEEKNLLHSFRRDGKFSGRALGVISMKDCG